MSALSDRFMTIAQQARADVDAVLDRAGAELGAIVAQYEAGQGGGTVTPTPGPTPIVPAGALYMELPFGPNPATPDGRTWTANAGGWNGGVLVCHFRTPATQTDSRGICNISFVVADGGQPAPSQAVVSLTPGDFDHPITSPSPFGQVKALSEGGGDTRTISFGIGNAPPGEVALPASTDCYFNVRYTDPALFGGNGRVYVNKPGYLL